MREQVEELLDLLESAHLDESERYVMTEKDAEGERPVIYNRERYLEFIVEVAMNDLMNMLDEEA